MLYLNKLPIILCIWGASIVLAYFSGRMNESHRQDTKALTEYTKEITKNANIDKQVNRMVEPAIDRALSRWMR
jgi:hypothetical protein